MISIPYKTAYLLLLSMGAESVQPSRSWEGAWASGCDQHVERNGSASKREGSIGKEEQIGNDSRSMFGVGRRGSVGVYRLLTAPVYPLLIAFLTSTGLLFLWAWPLGEGAPIVKLYYYQQLYQQKEEKEKKKKKKKSLIFLPPYSPTVMLLFHCATTALLIGILINTVRQIGCIDWRLLLIAIPILLPLIGIVIAISTTYMETGSYLPPYVVIFSRIRAGAFVGGILQGVIPYYIYLQLTAYPALHCPAALGSEINLFGELCKLVVRKTNDTTNHSCNKRKRER